MSLTKKEQAILNSIVIPSTNDPLKPEFPSDDPKFPATLTYQIKVPGFRFNELSDLLNNPAILGIAGPRFTCPSLVQVILCFLFINFNILTAYMD